MAGTRLLKCVTKDRVGLRYLGNEESYLKSTGVKTTKNMSEQILKRQAKNKKNHTFTSSENNISEEKNAQKKIDVFFGQAVTTCTICTHGVTLQ